MQPHGDQRLVQSGAPLGDAPVLLLVHGRGAAPANIMDLIPRLDRSNWTYLAPAAAGRTWYPLSFMAEREQNEPGLSSALWVLRKVVDDVMAKGVPSSRIVIMGFSQGACLASEFAARNPRRYGGVVAFTGGVIGTGSELQGYAGSFDGTPVFLGCSDVDAHVPLTRVDETEAIFTRLGATVTKRIYPGMGHLINDDEIAAAQDILDAVQAGA